MGPAKIADTARTLGKTMRAFRKASSDFTSAVTRELDDARLPPPTSLMKSKASLQCLPAKPGTFSKQIDLGKVEDVYSLRLFSLPLPAMEKSLRLTLIRNQFETD